MKHTHQAIFPGLVMTSMDLTGCFGGGDAGVDVGLPDVVIPKSPFSPPFWPQFSASITDVKSAILAVPG